MFLDKTKFLFLGLATASLAANYAHASANPEYIARQEEKKSAKVGQDVAIYGYPLVMMSLLKQYCTYTTAPGEYKAPINQFAHSKRQSTPLDTYSYPTIDGLTSSAWLDLSQGPLVFHVPEVYKRFYLYEVFDGWTNVVQTISSSTTDSKGKDFMFCGPEFKGITPKNVTLVRAKTNLLYIKGLMQCFGPDDYKNLHALQDTITLTPLASFGQPYSPPAMVAMRGPIATRESPADQVSEMNYTSFYNRLADLLQTNPPSTQDVAICKTMAELGMNSGAKFDAENINRASENGLEDAFTTVDEKINNTYSNVYTNRNHWQMIIRKEHEFGTDYLRRAQLARADLPTSLSENILTVTTDADYNGNRLNGMQKYRMHISKEELPPVLAFWSLTLYTDTKYLHYNKENIYAIQSFANSLKINKDGSCDIWIQNEQPLDTSLNWLPCPTGGFSLMFRLYQPQSKALEGHWMPPSIKTLNAD